MRYKLFGKSGLRVSELALGTMTFGTEWKWGADKDVSRDMFTHYIESGGNFIDTANRYTEGTSEKYVGKFVKDMGIRNKAVIATKYTLQMGLGDPNAAGNHRKNMVQALDASLKRLKTDYIDLYWLHMWDHMTPPEEVMRALDDAVRAGKILYIGISDTPAWRVAQCNTMAELRGWTSFVGLQVEYSLGERAGERELLPMSKAFDMAVTPWGVLAGGVLTGKYSKKNRQKSDTQRYDESAGVKRLSDRTLAIGDEVVQVAEDIGKPPSQVALNWVRQQSNQMIPIMGVRTVEQLKDNLGSLEFSLTDAQMKRLDEVSKIELGFPHDFLEAPYVRELVYAGTYEQIDNHRA